MADPVSQGIFFERMEQLQRQFIDSHTRLRHSMEAGFDDLRQKLDDHAKDDQKVADRVLVIETERKSEQAQAVRRGTWAGLLSATGLTALLKALEGHWWK